MRNHHEIPVYREGERQARSEMFVGEADEFQKILNHRGSGPTSLNFALAQLGFGRAQAPTGNAAAARAAYQDFFTLWKDADPNIPILKQAKAEYARLQ